MNLEKANKIKILERVLRFMAIVVLKLRKPIVIGITGSVGKTSTKEAVFSVLSSKFKVRKSEKNYNNEIGVPLTIIGAESGGRSLLKWVDVFLKWVFAVLFPVGYPKILILELGVDKPGDMKYLLDFIPVDIGIMTNVSSSHLEFFKSVDHIAREKGKLLNSIGDNGVAIFNFDDSRVKRIADKLKVESINFGLGEEAQIRATDIGFNYKDGKVSGIVFKLNYQGKIIPVRLLNILATHHVYSALAAVAAGIHFKMNLVDITSALEELKPVQGRMSLMEGKNDSLIVDDTYNASPLSTLAALDVMERIEAKRKIVILGDMMELGEESKKSHGEVISKAISIDSELVFVVGRQMKQATDEYLKSAEQKEYARKLITFEKVEDAAREANLILQKGDLFLVKGSRAMKMEIIVQEIMKGTKKVGIFLRK